MKVKNTNQLNVREIGRGADVVLLHGWGLNCGIFDTFAVELGKSHKVSLIDLPGYGENNGLIPQQYSLEAVAHQVADVIPAGAILTGWSLGGLIAQKVALLYPEKVAKLCLVTTSPKFASDRSESWFGIEPSVLTAFKNQLKGSYKKTLDRFMAIQAMGSATAKSDIARIRETVAQYPEPHPEALEKGLDILLNEDLRDAIPNLIQPTLRLYGRLDSLVPHKSAPLIASLHSASKTIILDKASHAPFISHPADFFKVFSEFINENKM